MGWAKTELAGSCAPLGKEGRFSEQACLPEMRGDLWLIITEKIFLCIFVYKKRLFVFLLLRINHSYKS
jgi:hypothetical protein